MCGLGGALIGTFGQAPVPLSTPGLLAAQVVRGDAPVGKALDASDFGGRPVLGAVQRVGGTPWYLVARIDRDEAYADARRDAWWTAAGGLPFSTSSCGGVTSGPDITKTVGFASLGKA